jgi:hypothetical protein
MVRQIRRGGELEMQDAAMLLGLLVGLAAAMR